MMECLPSMNEALGFLLTVHTKTLFSRDSGYWKCGVNMSATMLSSAEGLVFWCLKKKKRHFTVVIGITFIYILFVYLCISACVILCFHTHGETRGQLERVSSEATRLGGGNHLRSVSSHSVKAHRPPLSAGASHVCKCAVLLRYIPRILLFFYFLSHISILVRMCPTVYVWRSEDNLWGSCSFSHVGFRDQTQVTRLGDKRLHLPLEPFLLFYLKK